MARSNDPREYDLTMRQEPKQARMCGVGADRRPIDPPPIVQLRVVDPSSRRPQSNSSRASSPDLSAPPSAQSFLQNPYYFMFASLAKPDEDVELHWLKDGKTRCTTGSVVSSLYHLKDSEHQNADAGFFVFPDLSVRTEGSYRLKLSLYEVVGNNVYHCKSIFSAPFYVYTAKKFPGMEESTPLSCSLADQGIKIRIRKDIRVRKRPVPALDTPVPIPMGPVPIPHGAFGPVPVPLDDDDDDQDREREREREHERDRERDRDRERERRESGGSVGGAAASGSISRRESMEGRGAKRARADEPMVEDAGSSNAAGGWGPIDPALSAPQHAAPAQPTSAPQAAAPVEHSHYASAPPPAPAQYDHRYAAPAPPTPYHYDPHAHGAPPPPSHHYAPATHHYSVPPPPQHQHTHHPPPPPYASYSPPASAPGPGPAPAPTQSWPPPAPPAQTSYDPYAHQQQQHHYSAPPPPPPHHHQPAGPAPGPAPRYDYGSYPPPPPPAQQQPGAYGGYYEHHPHHASAPPPPPPQPPHGHHPSHHPGYAQQPPSPPAATQPYASEYGSPGSSAPASSGYGRGYAGAPPMPPQQYSYPSVPPPQSSRSHHNAPGPAPTHSGHSHYQLSTPPHHHASQGYSPYPLPPPPGGSGAPPSSSEGSWSGSYAPPPPAPGPYGSVPPDYSGYTNTAAPAAGGSSGGLQRIQLAPLRVAGGSSPPAGERQGSGGKKNPLSIGNIITEDST
ncbi:hypothetical protein K466DRAFT_585711 [Polyporus arcularius HHB13444]|uniref:Velvet domain-containing protein n=1 Tax=Polyporus arcularius HHB13444 TaxID=1314778 RepID=A0A5C3PG22_9APHY|nr:hypothetical protein K466DRAFT_585711 [Polyporus arcularius HHB13444]